MSVEWNAPGKVPPALIGTAAFIPKIEEWDPEGDVHLPDHAGADLYVPPIVKVPPQLPRPEQHPHRPEFPARGVRIFIDTAATDKSPGAQLGFNASSVQIDNFSNQWLFFPSAQRWIPPCYFGIILPIVPGTQVAEFRVQIPVGHAVGTVGLATSPVVTIWFEETVYPTAGVLLTV
jgi:hypothetical protein